MQKIFLHVFMMIFLNQLFAQEQQIFNAEEAGTSTSQTEKYVPLLEGQKVAVVANHASMINGVSLIDSLINMGVDIKRIFTPEHGFRGTADAGAKVNGEMDEKTGIEVTSLYGNAKKPTKEMLQDIDLILFDLQDVGVRFYTYVSTLAYVMEAAAENGVPVVVLDRPNPNGFYIDGPVLKDTNRSFVGMHPIPVVYGMTIGEYALMTNGEGWLENGVRCDLTVIPLSNYDRNAIYSLPIKPSPNLPDWKSVYLYPSLCFFEGTVVSVGRGTDFPFQIYGHPDLKGSYSFVPKSREGASSPVFEGRLCHGENLVEYAANHSSNPKRLNLEWIMDAYRQLNDKDFFTRYFRLLAGNDELQRQIEQGLSEQEIRLTWEKDLADFKKIRAKYLIYNR